MARPIPASDPFAGIPADLRNPNTARNAMSAEAAEFVRSGASAPRSAVGVKPTLMEQASSAFDSAKQRAGAAYESFRGQQTGATNGPTQTQIPNGNPNLAGQQMGATNTGSVGAADTAASGGKTSRLGAVKSFATGGGSSVGGAFKSVGGSALRAAGTLAASPIAAVGAAGYGAIQGFNTDTEQYAKRFGLENTEPGFLRDVGVRALGVASDIGNGLALGAPQALGAFRDKNEPDASTSAIAQPTQPTPLPSGTTNPNQRVARELPGASGENTPVPTGRFGRLSPEGTFGDGYTDMGGGIAGRGKGLRGQFNDFTNIGVNGQPTALSQGDSRTPDQIANAARINAETAKFVAEREAAKRVPPGQQYIADMERRSGIPFHEMTPRLRNAVMSGAMQMEQLGGENARAQISSETTRRGQDIQLETAALPERLRLDAAKQQRAAIAKAQELAGGDPSKTAEILAANGMVDAAKEFSGMATTRQAQAKSAADFNRDMVAAASTVTDKDGKETVSPALQARNEYRLRQMVPNYDEMTPDEKLGAQRQYLPALNVLQGANERRDDTLFKKLGWEQSAEMSTLPDLAGSRLERVNPMEGMFTFDAEAGDYALRLADGTTRYVNQKRVGQAEKEFLKARGASLRGE